MGVACDADRPERRLQQPLPRRVRECESEEHVDDGDDGARTTARTAQGRRRERMRVLDLGANDDDDDDDDDDDADDASASESESESGSECGACATP